MATIFQNESKVQNFVESLKLYPTFNLPNPLAQTTAANNPTPSISNIVLANQNLYFDLELSDTGFENYRNIKVLCLEQQQINTFERLNFPEVLSQDVADIFFKNKPNENIYAPKPTIENVKLDLKNKRYTDELKLFVVYQLEEKTSGQIFLLTIKTRDVFIDGIKAPLPHSQKKTIEEPIISNLYLSYSIDKNVSGFFAVDAEKLSKENTAFPNLIKTKDLNSLSKMLSGVQVYMTKYNTGTTSLLTDETHGPFVATRVKDLFVKNASGKIFYEFMARDISEIPKYKTQVSLSIIDPTITLATEILDQLLKAVSNNDRVSFSQLVNQVYGSKMDKEILVPLAQIDIMSVTRFNNYSNKVITKLRKDLKNTEKRTLYKNSDKDYMSPSPANFPFLQAPIIQTIKRKVRFDQTQKNVVVRLKNNFPFKTAMIDDVEGLNTTISQITTKLFTKINNLSPISKFKIFVEKDKTDTTNNLEPQINCSEDQTLIIKPLDVDTVPLSTTKDRTVDLFYLDRVGESASALIFEKLTQSSLDEALQQQNKLFVRLVNYEDFYDSYFYIKGNGET